MTDVLINLDKYLGTYDTSMTPVDVPYICRFIVFIVVLIFTFKLLIHFFLAISRRGRY
jgi:uncharacterized protein HemY